MWLKEILTLGLLFVQANSITYELYNADKIIQNVNKANTTWTAGHNFPKGITLGYLKSLLGTQLDVEIPKYSKANIDIDDWEIPEEFDARQKWPNCKSISHIRDQGDCGSCWAVSATSAFSDRYCIASHPFNSPLSATDILSCCTECGNGCSGGNPLKAWDYFVNTGVRTGGDFKSHVGCRPYAIPPCEHFVKGKRQPCSIPHKAKTPECLKNCTNPDYRKPRGLKSDYAKASSFDILQDVTEIQKEIMTNGPVQAAFLVYDDLPSYKTGVYRKTSDNKLAGHGVKIIGWGVENNTPYWLISNSWNTDWGDNGLFKMIRGQNECGIETLVIAGYPDV